MKTKIKSNGTVQTSWQLITYEVWGNAKDGFDVNDSHTIDRDYRLTLPIRLVNPGATNVFQTATPSMRDIRKAFGWSGGKLDISGGDDVTIEINLARNGKPLGEMRLNDDKPDHAVSLSPIKMWASRIKCDQCRLMMIQGKCCHEAGCPNSGKQWNAIEGTWDGVFVCRKCGTKHTDADDAAECCRCGDDDDITDEQEVETMTLDEWVANYGALPTTPTTERGAVSLTIRPNQAGYKLLWQLADYTVSSITGPIVWLLPK